MPLVAKIMGIFFSGCFAVRQVTIRKFDAASACGQVIKVHATADRSIGACVYRHAAIEQEL